MIVGDQFALRVLDLGNQDVLTAGGIIITQSQNVAPDPLPIGREQINRTGGIQIVGKGDLMPALSGDGSDRNGFDDFLRFHPLALVIFVVHARGQFGVFVEVGDCLALPNLDPFALPDFIVRPAIHFMINHSVGLGAGNRDCDRLNPSYQRHQKAHFSQKFHIISKLKFATRDLPGKHPCSRRPLF